jgi:hypothetical protein
MEIFLEQALADVKKVDEKKRYWFIRTYSGEAYQEYLNEGYVGVGVNGIPYEGYIKNAKDSDDAFKQLHKYVENNTHYKKGEATKIAKQLIAFNSEISVGDTVIIPSKNSSELAFGTITSNIYLVKDPKAIKVKEKSEFLPEKRRGVKWDKIINRDELQGDLRGMLASHHGVTNADDYKEIIEGTLESIFIQDKYIHLVIQIRQDEDINAFDLSRFLNGLTFFYNEFCLENGVELNEDLTIKIKLQSKGKTILKALYHASIVGLLGIIALSNNNELEADLQTKKIKSKSDGFFKSITEFLDATEKRREERIIFDESLKRLKATEKPIEGEKLSNNPTDSTKSKGE